MFIPKELASDTQKDLMVKFPGSDSVLVLLPGLAKA